MAVRFLRLLTHAHSVRGHGLRHPDSRRRGRDSVHLDKLDTDEGIEYLKKALAINPKSSKSLRDICVLYVKKKRWGEALVCIEEAERKDPDNPEIKEVKADVELFKSEFERLSAEEA